MTASTVTEESRYQGSLALHAGARQVLAGGVNSNFRLGGLPAPLTFERGEGPYLYDVDGNRYVDYALGMGPVILGHAPPAVLEAVAASLPLGQLFAGQHPAEYDLAREMCRLIPCAERVRLGMSGSEVAHLALRLARAYTGRPKIVRFEGHYHGWFDTVLVKPGEGTTPQPASAGQPAGAVADLYLLPWNDADVLADFLQDHAGEIAGLIMEPILCNTSVILPRPGYLETARELCTAHGIVLIFDEVITGFRVGLGGAQARLGVTPDLAVYAKALGAGFPISALAGRAGIMDACADGGVLHGGSYNSNVVSVAAARAALQLLSADGGQVYAEMERQGERLMAGIAAAARARGSALKVQGLGSVFNTAFTDQPAVADYRDYLRCDAEALARFVRGLQAEGVHITRRGTWFLSTAHQPADIDATVAAVERVLDAGGLP